jgi:hypothetical protein
VAVFYTNRFRTPKWEDIMKDAEQLPIDEWFENIEIPDYLKE